MHLQSDKIAPLNSRGLRHATPGKRTRTIESEKILQPPVTKKNLIRFRPCYRSVLRVAHMQPGATQGSNLVRLQMHKIFPSNQ